MKLPTILIGILGLAVAADLTNNLRKPQSFEWSQSGEYRHLALDDGKHTIPELILFTHEYNFLRTDTMKAYFENVSKTINFFKNGWENPSSKMIFLDDQNCYNGVKQVFPDLLPFYEEEARGPHRGDICRLVTLWKSGGYFFDVDLDVLDFFKPSRKDIEGVFVLDESRESFHLGFVAVKSNHPMMEAALTNLLDIYKDDMEVEDTRPAATALYEAYKSSSRAVKSKLKLLEVIEMDFVLHPYDKPREVYPEFERQQGNGACNIAIHDPKVEKPYFFAHFLGSKLCQKGLIPKTLWFSYSTNIWETKEPRPVYNNVVNTVRKYREFWGDMEAPVYFLDDDDCRSMINEVIPQLLPYFDAETVGAYKGDICRNAALYLHGGYYFDVDMFVVNKVDPKPETTFVSTYSCQGGCFFQAFFACTPKHPIVSGSLRKMLNIYKHNKSRDMIGPITMADAYHEMPAESRFKDTELFEEMKLDDGPVVEHYPNVLRQEGDGNCNYIVHDPERQLIFFFARFVGYHGCQPSEEQESID